MELLAKFRHAIASAESTEAVKLLVLDEVGDILDCHQIGLYLFESGGTRPSEIHFRHVPEAMVLRYEQLGREEDRVFAQVMTTAEATYDEQVYCGESWKRSSLYRGVASQFGIHHYLCAPIKVCGRMLGTLNLGRSSQAARFNRQSYEGAREAARIIGAHLTALSLGMDEPRAGRLSLKQSGQQLAERALLRERLEQIERHAAQLTPDRAAAYFQSFVHDEIQAIDCFDRGERRYVLLRLGEEPILSASRRCRFSAREIEILEQVIGGASNKAIAHDLGLAPSTVATHVSAAMAKLGVRSRVELIEELRRAPMIWKG